MHRLIGTLIVCSLAAGCPLESQPATAIVVSVQTDLLVGSELRELSYRVFRADADPELDSPVVEFSAPAQTLGHPFVILRQREQELLLSVEGYATQGDEPVVVQRVRARFVTGKSLALRIVLARACAYALCETPGLSCYGEPRGYVAAGECALIPGPEPLDEIAQAGDEGHWTPTFVPALDAGSGALFDAAITTSADSAR